jgi:hypothetical protein
VSLRRPLVTWNDLLEADAAGYQGGPKGRLVGSELLLAAFLIGVLRRGGQWRTVEQRVRQRLHQLHRDHADGIVDLDGRFVPAAVLLDMGRGSHYGRRKRVLLPRQGVMPGGRARKWEDMDASRVEFLRSGGWIIRKLGGSGLPNGRPAKGVRGPDLIKQRIEQLAGQGFDYKSASRDQRAELVAQLLAPPRPVNTAALAAFWNVNRSTIWRLNESGESRLQQNLHKRGGVSS